MTHEELQDLLGAYALDAVDPGEASEIEDHLRGCPRCRAEVAAHRETAAFLAHAGADAPPELWDRIAGSIEAPPADVVPMAPRLGFGARRAPNPWQRAASIVAAAAAVAVIGALGLQVRNQGDRINEMEAAMRVPDGKVVELTGDVATVPVVLEGDRAFLLGESLEALPEGRTYQLWGANGDELVSVAVLGRDPGVVSFDASGYSLLAITEERAPGVVRSEKQPVVAGSLA